MGRALIILGIILIAAGLFASFGPRLPFRLGRLPGDIAWRGKNSAFYFPITTSILLSVSLSLVFWLIGRFR